MSVQGKGVSAQRGVSAQGEYLPGGCLSKGAEGREGCLPGGVWQTPPSPGSEADTPPHVERQTLVKTLPSQTSFAGGNNIMKYCQTVK